MANLMRCVFLALTLIVFGGQAWSQVPDGAPRVVIVSSDSAAAYAQAADALTESLVRQGVARAEISQSLATDLSTRLKSGSPLRPAIFVALGTEATQLLVAAGASSPVLSALIPRSSFERILRGNGKATSARLTAIYLDQPLARQLALVRQVFPLAKRLGVLWGGESSDRAAGLKSLVTASGMELQEATVTQLQDLPGALAQVLAQSDVLLALADPLVFNSATIQNILMASFRARIALVAFSPAYVRAGAVLAIYTTPVQAANQAAELVLSVLHGRPLPDRAQEPNDFEVGVNAHVARALDLSPDAQTLRSTLRRLERLP
jgi:putative ABC transport system substrate-binding protein